MKTIKSLKEITTLEVDDKVVFGDLKYRVNRCMYSGKYYLLINEKPCNDEIFKILNVSKKALIKHLGINADTSTDFPQVKSLEALTAIVSALFKEYEKQNELPKTWEEFCEKNKVKEGECHIDSMSNINRYSFISTRIPSKDKNVCISVQEAEAHLAIMQLRQLRKAYVKDWEPNWICGELVHSVGYNYFLNELVIESSSIWGNCMSFPTEKLANQFLNNFKDLLEIAKPLL